jgi:hypothetical protein
MMYPTPRGAWSRRYRIPPEKLSANVANKVGTPTFSNKVVHTEVRLTKDMLRAVSR